MNQKRTLLLTSIGAGLEYYDFVIYALLANFIGDSFFPNNNHYTAIMTTFAIFGIGYVVRPIGGILFGIIADCYGRKKAFTATIFLMSVSTFMMGITPPYLYWGLTAPCIFVILRILQGLSYGAELPGSLTFLAEHIAAKNRGKKCSIMIASMGIGVTIASFVSYLIIHFLTTKQMNLWGWRLPFILGGFLALIGYFLRKYTTETPLFIKMKKDNFNTLALALKNNYKNLLRGFGFVIFPACFVIFGLFMPSYLHDYFKYQLATIYLINTVGNIWVVILLPIFGWYSDHVGRKKLLLMIAILVVLFILPLFKCLAYANIFALCGFIICYYTIIASLASCYFAMLAENFPTSIRYTGIALCYNLTYTVAAFAPVLFSYICKNTKNPENISFVFIILAILTIFSVLTVTDRTGKELV